MHIFVDVFQGTVVDSGFLDCWRRCTMRGVHCDRRALLGVSAEAREFVRSDLQCASEWCVRSSDSIDRSVCSVGVRATMRRRATLMRQGASGRYRDDDVVERADPVLVST
jgi:hypothetical protein